MTRRSFVAAILAPVVASAGLLTGCTHHGSATATPVSNAPGASTTASSTPQYIAMPGQNGTALIAAFKAALGPNASELRTTGDVPAGQQSVYIASATKLAGPGSVSITVAADDEATTYRLDCGDFHASLGTVGPIVGRCADLAFAGVDNARVRTWVAARRSGSPPSILTIGHVQYYFTYDAERTMSLIVSYLGTGS